MMFWLAKSSNVHFIGLNFNKDVGEVTEEDLQAIGGTLSKYMFATLVKDMDAQQQQQLIKGAQDWATSQEGCVIA